MSYLSITFPGRPEYVHEVRAWLTKALGDVPGADVLVLVASELTANAIRHTSCAEPGGTFTVHVAAYSNRWHVRVDDQGGPNVPQVLCADDLDDAGRGLALVEAVSTSWGVLGDQYARAVWAEIPMPLEEVS